MRLLQRTWQNQAFRHLEIFAIEGYGLVAKHWDDGLNSFLPYFAFGFEVPAKRLKLGSTGAFANSEFNPAIGK